MENKRLLLISTRVFWPPMSGHEVEIYHYCRGLHDQYGYTIDVYVFGSQKKDECNNKPYFLNNIIFSTSINFISKTSNLLSKSFLSRNKLPLQCSLYYSKENEKRISELVEKNKYDVVIVDMVRLAVYHKALENYSCQKILDIDDMLSKRYKRQLNAISSKSNIAGNYYKRLPVLCQKLLNLVFIKKMVLKTEIPRMERAEKYYSDLYDNVIFVSAIETKEFNEKYHTDKAVTVSLGVDFPFYSEDIPVDKIDGCVTFVGNMTTPANADSVRMIINDILPLSKRIQKIVIVGYCPDDLSDEFKDVKKVQFTGKVDDLRKYVKQGMVFLAPIIYGTGIKTKILEAMAMGMPVVTNSVGSEGIHAENGKHWLVSDDPAKIAQYVDELLESQYKCDEMGKNAKEFIENNFQWDIIFEQFKSLGL